MNEKIDLSPEHWEIIQNILESYLPGVPVWAYGSRVKETAHPASDLDIVVFTEPNEKSKVSESKEAFEESNLPFRVDVFIWDEIPKNFQENIKAKHVTLK